MRGAHSATSIYDATLKGLLEDQQGALEMLFAHVEDGGRPLTASAIREWHALLTRHQASATGIDQFGRRAGIPLRQGRFKIGSNNPLRLDGFEHEYCSPEQVDSELERFFAVHDGPSGPG